MALPILALYTKFVIYTQYVSPVVIIIIFLLLMWAEDLFPGQVVYYTILRRRIGDTKGPWEDFYLFQNTFSDKDYDLFTDFTNNLYSSDGFFPHTFNERMPFPNPSFTDRFMSQTDIINYNEVT